MMTTQLLTRTKEIKEIDLQIAKLKKKRVRLVAENQAACTHTAVVDVDYTVERKRMCVLCGLTEKSGGGSFKILRREGPINMTISESDYRDAREGFTIEGEKSKQLATSAHPLELLTQMIKAEAEEEE